MASWEPHADGVREICQLLHEYLQPGVDQQAIFMQLQKCSQYPDFNNYLTYILTHAEQGQAIEVRQSAGLLLKNNLKSGYSSIPPQYQQYIKGQLLPLIGSPNRHLRSVAGTVISVLVQHSGPASWPELWAGLARCLESGAPEAMEGALDSLYKICEEDPLQMGVEVPGLPQKPVDAFLPRLIALFASPHRALRRLALGTVNQFVISMPPALQMHLDAYLQGLFALATDGAGEVRKLVCAGLVSLLEVQPDALLPHMRNVMEYMLQASQDTDTEVALEASEFWSAFCEAHLPAELLREFLPRLMGVLLKNMEYADDDEAVLSIEDDEETVPDREEDIKPFFHHSKVQGAGGDGEGEVEEEDDIVNVWNLRKCSAAGLDTLSASFGDELLPLLMPLVQARLASGSEEKWKEREAGVLAMGAIAEGCITGLLPHLSQMVLFLLPMLEDKQPLVRSITCWTLSRYSRWVVKAAQESGEQIQLEGILVGLLQRILDTNKCVQEAACSSFATLEEEAGEELSGRLEPILKHLMFALQKYHRKNLRILYDAIGTLADVVGGDLADPPLLDILMPPLVAKWQQLHDIDKDILPLLECLTSIAQALGPAFAPYTEPVFDRCLSLIRQQAVAKADPEAAGKHYDKEFVVCSLDLLSGLAEGLGTSIESLVGRTDLRELLLACCADEAPDVRQSAFALLGDLAKSCVVHLQPRLADFLTLATAQLQQDRLTAENISGANNACWAVGELSTKVREAVVPFVLPVVGCLVPILRHEGGAFNKSMIENSAITLGRLGWIAPEQVAPHMDHFVTHWCKALRSIRDDIEKEQAFMGLCAIVKLNPSGALPAFKLMCEAIGSWHEIHSPDLRQQLAEVLAGFKQMLGDGWSQYFGSLDQPLQLKLVAKYNL